MKIEVFDPAMCCSTGVCGPSVDPALATFAGDLDWLAEQGASVQRFNLGQQPGEFVGRAEVKALLDSDGEAGLPAVFIEGEMKSTGRFPSRDELASWARIGSSTVSRGSSPVSEAMIVELAAIGAAIGANCQPCFKYHYAEARKLGLSNADLALAVRTAQTVKNVPAAKVLDTAARLLGVDAVELGGAEPADESEASASAGCCGAGSSPETTPAEVSATSSAGCC